MSDDFIYEITTKVTEDYDKFVFETIKPYCEYVTEQVIDKKTLYNALVNYIGTNGEFRGNRICPRCKVGLNLLPEKAMCRSEVFCWSCGIKINRFKC